MKREILVLILATMILSCSSEQEIKTKKDTIFGLELGMKQEDVTKLLTETLQKDSGNYYFYENYITHLRGAEDKKVELNFYKPTFKDSVLVDYSYTLRMMSSNKDYLAEFHKQMFDDLKKQHGNTTKADSTNDKESILNWDLGNNATLELKIDKKDNLYSLNYKLKDK